MARPQKPCQVCMSTLSLSISTTVRSFAQVDSCVRVRSSTRIFPSALRSASWVVTMLLHIPFDIRYVEWMGELWTVANVETQRPRLILTLGEVYNGPTSTTTVTP
jgi:hypothetical protein